MGRAGEVLVLAWTIYLSFLGALVALMAGNKRPLVANAIALLAALAGLSIAIAAVSQYHPAKS